jgi:hypothetical protein
MGRGRAKAKQQKVARELKYHTRFTDLDALQRELGVSDSQHPEYDPNAAESGADSDDADGYDEPDGYDSYQDWTGTER